MVREEKKRLAAAREAAHGKVTGTALALERRIKQRHKLDRAAELETELARAPEPAPSRVSEPKPTVDSVLEPIKTDRARKLAMAGQEQTGLVEVEPEATPGGGGTPVVAHADTNRQSMMSPMPGAGVTGAEAHALVVTVRPPSTDAGMAGGVAASRAERGAVCWTLRRTRW